MPRSLQQLAKTVQLRAIRAVNLRPVWREADDRLCRDAKRHFSGGRLRRSGRLERSLTNPSSPEHVFEEYPQGMRWGTVVPYAKYLINGTRKMRRKLDIALSPEMSKTISKMCAEYIQNGEVSS